MYLRTRVYRIRLNGAFVFMTLFRVSRCPGMQRRWLFLAAPFRTRKIGGLRKNKSLPLPRSYVRLSDKDQGGGKLRDQLFISMLMRELRNSRYIFYRR